ncbi:hypothetical protein TNCV_3510901 [Trichonephila clavipes]|nr:hypothetical protein TNCV_3510901 [Trichonephila clavipes]
MLDRLEDNIRRVIADIRPQMLEKVIENWTSSLDYIRASCGSHMPEIILKISSIIQKSHSNIDRLFLIAQQEKELAQKTNMLSIRAWLLKSKATSNYLNQDLGPLQ